MTKRGGLTHLKTQCHILLLLEGKIQASKGTKVTGHAVTRSSCCPQFLVWFWEFSVRGTMLYPAPRGAGHHCQGEAWRPSSREGCDPLSHQGLYLSYLPSCFLGWKTRFSFGWSKMGSSLQYWPCLRFSYSLSIILSFSHFTLHHTQPSLIRK